MQNQYNLMIVFKHREIRKGSSSFWLGNWVIAPFCKKEDTGGEGDMKYTPLVHGLI